MTEVLPTYPDIIPNSIRESKVHQLEEGGIQTEEDLRNLILLMYDRPERDFYYFRRREDHLAGPLDWALDKGLVLEEETEFFWYRDDPTGSHGYVRVEVRDGDYQWDWQRQAVEQSPMFVRVRLRLPERTKRELEIREKIQAEREAESNPIELKPGWFGFSIDIFKACQWVRRLYGRRLGRNV